MRIVYQTEYFYRHIFVIEHDNKVVPVYRSSGLSGTGHEGKILPFSGINTARSFSEPLGYIFKEMFYNGKFMVHNKSIERFENVKENMDIISSILPENLKQSFNYEEIETQEQMELIIRELAWNIKEQINKYDKFFDLKNLILV